jgi:hypothetical protein
VHIRGKIQRQNAEKNLRRQIYRQKDSLGGN